MTCKQIRYFRWVVPRRGPISCGVAATDGLDYYKKGVYEEYHEDPTEIEINHDVSVVGWGIDEDSGECFWGWLRCSQS